MKKLLIIVAVVVVLGQLSLPSLRDR